jgi:hypothetical protein
MNIAQVGSCTAIELVGFSKIPETIPAFILALANHRRIRA